MNSPVSYEIVDSIGVITVDNPPVNALSHAVRQGILDALRTAQDDASEAIEWGAAQNFPVLSKSLRDCFASLAMTGAAGMAPASSSRARRAWRSRDGFVRLLKKVSEFNSGTFFPGSSW